MRSNVRSQSAETQVLPREVTPSVMTLKGEVGMGLHLQGYSSHCFSAVTWIY